MGDKFTPQWTIEPHGMWWVLYSGRDEHHHGANLLTLSEPDASFPATSRLIASAPSLLSAVEAVEWVDTPEGISRCPWCQWPKVEGHAAACQRQAAVKMARGEGS